MNDDTPRSTPSAAGAAPELESFYRAIADHVAHPIFVKDRGFRFVFVNQALCRMVGYSRAQMLGKTDYDFFPKEESDFFRRKDLELFATGGSVEIAEEPITDAAGVRHVLATTKVPLRNAAGEIVLLVGIIHDITRLKNVEEDLRLKNLELAEEVRERTRSAEQLATLNRELEMYTSSVSHDLRVPLRVFDGFCRLLQEDYAPRLDAPAHEYLTRMLSAAGRMERLLDAMLKLSRVTRAEMRIEPVDLSLLARVTANDLRAAQPQRAAEFVIQDGLIVRGDLSLLQSVVENLLGNAWKFTAQVARTRIELGAERRGEETVYFVRDNGVGFDPAQAGRLFRPFERLHPPTEFPGTGIGLATVQRIVARHGGRMWAIGEPQRGATFCFTLNVAAGTPVANSPTLA